MPPLGTEMSPRPPGALDTARRGAIAVHRIDLTATPEELRAEVSALAATLTPATPDHTRRMVDSA